MHVAYQVAAAMALDFIAGDPRWLPHPVKIIGRLACGLEGPMRGIFQNARIAGIAAASITILGSAGAAMLLLFAARKISPLAADALGVLIIYTTIAARDLERHSRRVYRALAAGALDEARGAAGMMVGRDTACLDEKQVVRATVESVAENLVDGVTAPLFFAIAGGPVAAIAYKAINTLDSTFGYRTPRYLLFGWASARIDDIANWLPARLTAPCIAVASFMLGQNGRRAAAVAIRDHGLHDSPNAGIPEAAFAGALEVQLGGLNYYHGIAEPKPLFGDDIHALERRHIIIANRLMYVSAILFAACCLGVRHVLFP
jgi:adenosylcobinamide-phosphate synthase